MSSSVNTFVDKLKEQSFTIILMTGILFYQNKLFNETKQSYEQTINEKDSTIKLIYEEERKRFLEREEYLIHQRDSYVDDLIRNVEN
jgi:hypothetical protein